MSKLTQKQVRAIKERLLQGESGAQIAKDYGVSRQAIHLIKIGESYPEVGRERMHFKAHSTIPEWKILVVAVMLHYGLPKPQIADMVDLARITIYRLRAYINDHEIDVRKITPNTK